MSKRRRLTYLGAFGLMVLVLLAGLTAAGCGTIDQAGSVPVSALAVQPSSATAATTQTEKATTASLLTTTTVSVATTTAAPTTTAAQVTTTTAEVTTTVTETATTTESGSGVTVYITKTGAKYHRAGCSSLSQSKIPISLEEAKAQGFEPCKRCKPPV